jgi:predicted metal-dependent hydrolase
VVALGARAGKRLEDVQAILPFDAGERIAPSPAPRGSVLRPPVVMLVRHPRARRYVIRVRPDGTVRVTLPRWGSKKEALAFAERQRDWVETQLRRLESEQRSATEQIAPEAQRELRQQAVKELPSRLMELAASLGLHVARISIRNQKWRWGSCSREGHICLNWRLVAMPAWVRDYVLIHELMHLKRLDHSPKFWALVARACPNYKDARAWLRSHEHMLSAVSC